MDPWIFYWIDIINKIRIDSVIISIILFIILGFIGVALFGCFMDDSLDIEDFRKMKKFIYGGLAALFLFGTLGLMLPSKGTIIAMAVSPYVTESMLLIKWRNC